MDLDWGKFSEGQRRARIPLPTYPFQRQRYWLDPADKSRRSGARSGSTRSSRYHDVSSCFYVPTWSRLLLLPTYTMALTERYAGSWVVFADTFGLSTQMVSRLQQASQPVVVVTSGDGYRWTGESSVTIDRRAPSDYVRLIEEITAQFGAPQRILHLGSVSESSPRVLDPQVLDPQVLDPQVLDPQVLDLSEDPCGRFAHSQERGYYSVLYLAQALTRLSRDRVSLLAVGNGLCDVSGGEALCPDKATLLGLCTVIGQENAELRCRCIDIMCPRERQQADLADRPVTC